jgi:hypothetical protein
MSKRQYARGKNAVAECQRSGQKMRYRDLVEDGHISGLLVHPDWWEPKHPQEIPVEVTDPIALFRPAPEISIPAGHGDSENLDGGVTPTIPTTQPLGTLANTLSGGETSFTTEVAVRFAWNHWVFIELDAGGYFVSRAVEGFSREGTSSPIFLIPLTSTFSGAAAQGNNFYIEETGGYSTTTGFDEGFQ